MTEEPIYTTREDYFSELGVLSGKIRKRRRLRSEYYSLMASLRRYLTLSRYYAIMSSIRALLAEARRLEWAVLVASLEARPAYYRRIRELYAERASRIEEMRHIRVERSQRLEAMRHIREDLLPPLEKEIEDERRRISRKKIPPPPPKKVLVRIKIRLYNEEREATPTGTFQTFWDIDAIMDPDTELIDWEWWLTEEEIAIAKYHMIGYFKGMAKWQDPEQLTLAYFTDPSGIPSRSDKAVYGRSHKNLPVDFIKKAEALTIEELIVGISSAEPDTNFNPTAENMGVFFERALIIKNEMIVWDEIRNKWVFHPTDETVARVKKELKIIG
ncbi:hypothetical protein ES707_10324 [subsurface metagenome]